MTKAPIQSQRERKQKAVIIAQLLSYTLIITFILANERFHLIQLFDTPNDATQSISTLYSTCLVALVGTINIWLTLYYFQHKHSISELLVLCAWTKKVKAKGKWISLEEYFIEHLGFEISHGMSECKKNEMLKELEETRKSQFQSSSVEDVVSIKVKPEIGYNSLQTTNNPKTKTLPLDKHSLSSTE